MKRIAKIAAFSLVPVAVIGGGGLSYFCLKYPAVGPAPSLQVPRTAERIERGKYLAVHVAGCVDCHSDRDWSRFGGPLVTGTEGRGGQRFDKDVGVPGVIFASNITPAAVGGWTDGEVWRAVTEGVSRDGRPLFPLMPYPSFGRASEEDIAAAIAYIRTLPAIENAVPPRSLDFPVSLLVRAMPAPARPEPRPPAADAAAAGRYLARLAGCSDCHTPFERGRFVAEMEYAGGREFRLNFGVVRSANITPDPENGIGEMSVEQFLSKFRANDPARNAPAQIGPAAANTVMPWAMYAGMTDEDLGAIYEHLRAVKPIAREVVRFTMAPPR